MHVYHYCVYIFVTVIQFLLFAFYSLTIYISLITNVKITFCIIFVITTEFFIHIRFTHVIDSDRKTLLTFLYTYTNYTFFFSVYNSRFIRSTDTCGIYTGQIE